MNSVIETGLYALLLESISDWPQAIQEELMQLYLVNPEAQTFTSLRRRIAHSTQGYHYYETEWLNNVAEEEEWEDLEAYLESLTTPGGQAWLLQWRVATGDWEAAEDVLDTFPDDHPDWALARGIWQLALANVTDSTDFMISKAAADSLFRLTGPSDESFYLLKNTFEYYGFETPLLVPVPYIDLERKKPLFPFFGTKKSVDRDMIVFPNPAKNALNIYLKSKEPFVGVMDIFDSNGRLVWTQTVNFSIRLDNIDVSFLKQGEYKLLLHNQAGVVLNSSFVKL